MIATNTTPIPTVIRSEFLYLVGYLFLIRHCVLLSMEVENEKADPYDYRVY